MTTRRSTILGVALLAALPLLSGCVAAALPMLAAGGLVGTRIDGDRSKSPVRERPRVSVDIARAPLAPASPGAPGTAAVASAPAGDAAPGTLVRNYTLDDGTRMEVMAGPLDAPRPATGGAPAVMPSPVRSDAPASFVLEDGTRVTVVSGGMPAPTGPGAGPSGFAGYDSFYGYAADQAARPVAGGERLSAMLAAPNTLAPKTRECSIHPAAVLIDLDPANGTLDPAAAVHADPTLAGKLAELRAQEVSIAWISANTADRAGAVRRALVASGLDPGGHDQLALLRYPEERKQTRREDLAKQYCIVAIAGDDRRDFDELFQYLKDPSLATPLEPLIGKGWFLIPQPLS